MAKMTVETPDLEVKIFVVSMILQELLDETEGQTKFKNKTRYHINGLQKELDKLLSVEIRDDILSLFITEAMGTLEGFFDSNLLRALGAD